MWKFINHTLKVDSNGGGGGGEQKEAMLIGRVFFLLCLDIFCLLVCIYKKNFFKTNKKTSLSHPTSSSR